MESRGAGAGLIPGARGYDGLEEAIRRESGLPLRIVDRMRDVSGVLIRVGDLIEGMTPCRLEVMELYPDLCMARVRLPGGNTTWFEVLGPMEES